MDGVVIHNCYDHLLMFHVEPTPPGRQQGEVTSRQQGVTLRAHPAGIEELLGELLLNCLEVPLGYSRGTSITSDMRPLYLWIFYGLWWINMAEFYGLWWI